MIKAATVNNLEKINFTNKNVGIQCENLCKCIFLNHKGCNGVSLVLLLSSLPEVFYEKDVLRNFAKFTGKHLCQGIFLNKVADLRPATLLTLTQVFSSESCEISKTLFLTEHFRWLLLAVV